MCYIHKITYERNNKTLNSLLCMRSEFVEKFIRCCHKRSETFPQVSLNVQNDFFQKSIGRFSDQL